MEQVITVRLDVIKSEKKTCKKKILIGKKKIQRSCRC